MGISGFQIGDPNEGPTVLILDIKEGRRVPYGDNIGTPTQVLT